MAIVPYPFLTPKWLVGHLLLAVLVSLFIWAGFWQLDRLAGRKAQNALLESRQKAAPLSLESLPGIDPENLLYRSAQFSGWYDHRYEVLLRTAESYDGQAVHHLLSPLVLTDNLAIIVNRGAVPYSTRLPRSESASAERDAYERVEVQGLLLADADPVTGFLSYFAPRDPPEGVLETIGYPDLDRIALQVPYELLPVYLEAHIQQPAPEGYPLLLEADELSNGPHLGYAIQWFSFAFIGIAGYSVLLRRVRLETLPHHSPKA